MKHHYVPVFYQKLFAASDGLLWVYDRKLKTFKQLHPESICCQHDLYAFEGGIEPNQIVETQFLSAIDGSASAALKKLPTVLAKPAPELLGEILYFAALQFLRVPANRRFASAVSESGGNDLMEAAFGDVERVRASIEEYETQTGEALGATPESMVEAVRSWSIRAVATERPFLQIVLQEVGNVARLFQGLDIRILISPPQVGFILSDNPLTIVLPRHVDVGGFKTAGAFTFLPLTRGLCLSLGQPGTGTGPRNIDHEAVRFINENTAANSDRFVMGKSKMQLESVIRRSGSADVSNTERWTIEKHREQDGIFSQLIIRPRRVHYVDV